MKSAAIKGALALALLGGGAFGQSKPSLCSISEDQDHCVRVLACYGEEGLWFHGRSYGRGKGSLAGQRSDGVMCAGTWVSRNVFGVGQADVACEDDDTLTVIFTIQDDYTGTAIGHGRAASGQAIKAWSGAHVLEHLRRDGMPDGTLLCGPQSIPMS